MKFSEYQNLSEDDREKYGHIKEAEKLEEAFGPDAVFAAKVIMAQTKILSTAVQKKDKTKAKAALDIISSRTSEMLKLV